MRESIIATRFVKNDVVEEGAKTSIIKRAGHTITISLISQTSTTTNLTITSKEATITRTNQTTTKNREPLTKRTNSQRMRDTNSKGEEVMGRERTGSLRGRRDSISRKHSTKRELATTDPRSSKRLRVKGVSNIKNTITTRQMGSLRETNPKESL